jgi:hypothetical protein
LWQACHRRRAEDALMVTRGLLAAGGALLTKSGAANFRKYERLLLAATEEGLTDPLTAAKTRRRQLFNLAVQLGAARKAATD